MWKFFNSSGAEKLQSVGAAAEIASATGVSGGITATTVGTAQVVVTLPTVTFDGNTKIIIEAEISYVYLNSCDILEFRLYESGVDQGRLIYFQTPTRQLFLPATIRTRPFTPSAGPKSYSIRAIVNTGSGTIGDVVWGRITNADMSGPAGPVGKVDYGTAFPTSPTDGQEFILVDSITNPSYQWRFRYNAGSTSAYKWEFVGGAPLIVNLSTSQVGNFASVWGNLGTVGPDFIVPRAGDWQVDGNAQVINGASPDYIYIGLAIANGAPVVSSGFGPTAAVQLGLALIYEFFGLAAADIIRMRYLNGNQNATWQNRKLKVVPVRCS